jgi:hypothetical protein
LCRVFFVCVTWFAICCRVRCIELLYFFAMFIMKKSRVEVLIKEVVLEVIVDLIHAHRYKLLGVTLCSLASKHAHMVI